MTIGFCLMAITVFAQKKAVTEAERIAKDSKPDFNEARTLIKGALENPETKDDAKTWYVAGQIEDAQFSSESTKQMKLWQIFYHSLKKPMSWTNSRMKKER